MVSLRDQLAELEDPQPVDFDPEDAERMNASSDDEFEENDDEKAREHYVKVGKSKLRDDGISVDETKYRGKRVDRRALFDNDLSEDEEEESDSDAVNGLIDDEAEEESEDEEEDSEEEESEEESEEEDLENGMTASEEEVDDDEDDEEESESNGPELSKLLGQEKKKIVSRLSETARADAEKGAAVQKQMDIYEGLLDMRIGLQKALGASNLLPLDKASAKEFITDETPDLRQDALGSLYDFIDRLSDVRVKLMQVDNIAVPEKLSKKRNLEEAFGNVSALDETLSKYRESVLDKWSRKIQASSGATALQSSKFKSLNQTAAVQVGTILADMDRLIKRTRLNRSNYKILGLEEEESEVKQKVDTQEETYIFDDTDFYRMQLKELVDKRMADNSSGQSANVKWTVAKTKTKKVVDTKASKGRKLRYHVQEMVQGFAAPNNNAFTWNDDQRDDLFASLFGQQVRVDEESEHESEDEIVADTGFQVFA
ncbi:protein Bfr2p [Trichomonascus vanleenenianus]|uniref:AATF family protein n=1 Tax=Trichomonascus vanleenenianus TaxID=2268995 RepID=UPI003EC95A76